MGHWRLVFGSRAIGLGLLLLSSGLATAADSAPSSAEARLLAGTQAQAASSYGDPCKVHVFFTDRLRPPSAENPANFAISPDVTVTAAAYDRQRHVVTLTVSPGLAEGVGYTLSVQGLLDAVGRPVPAVALPLDFAPIPADGLVFWLRSDRRILANAGNRVLIWGDASAGRNDLSALPDHAPTLRASDGDTPAAVIFGGTERLFSGMTRELNTDALTWCIVFRPDDASRPQILLRSAYAAGAWRQSRDLWGVKLDAGTVTGYSRSRRGAEFAVGVPVDNGVWSTFTTVWDAPALSAWLDGTPAEAVSGADANPKAHLWLALGGGDGDEPDSGFAGAVAEVVVYSRALSEAERLAMENYLAGKYIATSDSDGDGLPDAWELEHFGNLDQGPDGDYDNDGLTNVDEYLLGTDPVAPDTDGDAMPDGWEVCHGLDPLDPADAHADLDADGVANLVEYQLGRKPNLPATPDPGGILDFKLIFPGGN